MIYLDTSLIVAALTGEADDDRVWNWLDRQAADSLMTSRWTITEVSSALSLKVRTAAITVDQRAAAQLAWRKLRSDSLFIAPVRSSHFTTAAAYADQHELGLRAGDALHIAVAVAGGHSLATLDMKMARAAPLLGVPVEALVQVST